MSNKIKMCTFCGELPECRHAAVNGDGCGDCCLDCRCEEEIADRVIAAHRIDVALSQNEGD